MPAIPKNYVPLPGSERSPARGARLLRAAHEEDTFKVTIVVRRRTDGAAVPDFSHYLKTPPSQRRRLPHGDFVKKYGAHPGDLAKVEGFAKSHGLAVEGANGARRTVVVSGTVAQFSHAFAVDLNHYEHEVTTGRRGGRRTESYRGRSGFIHIPKDLDGVIVGVFGLDNRRISKFNIVGDGAKGLQKGYDMPAQGLSEIQLWSRDFGKQFEVVVEWKDEEASESIADDSVKGRVSCGWDEYERATVGGGRSGGKIPSLEEVMSFLPEWAVVSKSTSALFSAGMAFEV